MTSTTEPRRAVMMHPDAWGPFEKWATAVGLQLTEVTHHPGQMPRYKLSGDTVRSYHRGGELTQRELEVLVGMSQGCTNKEIGARLFIAEDTVKTHARRLYRKLGVTDRAHAVAIAYQRHILGGA